MRWSQILFSQGFGTRRECDALLRAGLVTQDGAPVDDDAEVAPDDLWFEVRGERWPYRAKALVVLHKPAGYECSRKPRHHPGVLNLLPPPLRLRDVQPVGRLDADTTGLLLLTDDGALIHRRLVRGRGYWRAGGQAWQPLRLLAQRRRRRAGSAGREYRAGARSRREDSGRCRFGVPVRPDLPSRMLSVSSMAAPCVQ